MAETNPQFDLEVRVQEIRYRLGRLKFVPPVDEAESLFTNKIGYTQNFHRCFDLVKDWDIVYPGGPAHMIIFATCDGAGQLIQDHSPHEERKVYAEWSNWEEAPIEICKAWCKMMEKKT